MTSITLPTAFPAQAGPEAVVSAPNVRFTVLASRLIRLEYSRANSFEDRASQTFICRRLPVPAFRLAQTPDTIEIETEHLLLRYTVTPAGFTPKTLSIRVKATEATWRFGDRDWQNLWGTARTLDQANGAIPLELGLLSRAGWTVVDDSQSLVFNEDGWLAQRPPNRPADYRDLYFFGFGHDYVACLEEYGRVAGPVPLVPRFALGNWWSRYWDYRQDELRDLMVEFRAREVPLSVCIIDLDWHLRQTGNASSGWTGYTWNRGRWPDPAGFLAWLHGQGLRTALNLHPAEGVWPHEAQYEAMARHMGQDPAEQDPVLFDIADPQFVEGYFSLLHHPLEAEGVDFWWLDWQQGQRMAGSRRPLADALDPLWWLNHLHFYDLGRDGRKRPFIFSRWGGLGSHRYPIGFSGDSIVSWATLAFQPYFTATAANVAFGWWSHDIGGHCGGTEDPELYARWVQLGVFSPILRLHSTNNAFLDRRPWGNGAEAFRASRAAMQLRHRLIPYLYSMAWRATQKSVPLVTPLYWWHAEREEAYHCPGQFYFGSELLVAPFVTPRHPETNLSRHSVWLPAGDWFDFHSGERFGGDCTLPVYGGLDEIPVFARAGALVPLGPAVGWGGVEPPDELTVYIFPGAHGGCTLFEDDGASRAYEDGDYALTQLVQIWGGGMLAFGIAPVAGNAAHVPAGRRYRLVVRGVRRPDATNLAIDGVDQDVAGAYDAGTETLTFPALPLGPASTLDLTLTVAEGSLLGGRDRRVETCRAMLQAFRLASDAKQMLLHSLPALAEDLQRLRQFAGDLDQVSDAQWAALRSVLERVTPPPTGQPGAGPPLYGPPHRPAATRT